LTSKSSASVLCDKNPASDNNENCPIVTIEYATIGGRKKTYELENMDTNRWMNDDGLNRYYSTFTVTDNVDASTEAHVSITGPPADVSIQFDDVFFRVYEAPSCNNLVLNGNAKGRTTKPWDTYYGGEITIGTFNNSRAFKSTGRKTYTSGPKQAINTDCLVEGMRYEFKAKIKLEEENGDPFYCSMDAEWKSDFYCVILSIKMKDASGGKILNLANESTDYWDELAFNDFRAVFTATKELVFGDNMFFILRGPKVGVSIIFTEVSIVSHESPGRRY